MTYHLGTGSWADPEYKKLLVAPAVPAKERLRAYAAWFDHVEFNGSYHHMPPPATVAKWVEQTPAGFTFDFKLHRLFSQNPQRTATEGPHVAQLREAVQPLIEAQRLGCFLLVLPPSFSPEKHRLAELDAVAEKLAPHPLAVELRHRDWLAGSQRTATLDYYRARQLVWVAVDMPQLADSTLMPPTDEVTRADRAYLRLHGRNPRWHELNDAEEKHTYAYDDTEIAELVKRARSLARRAKHVHLIANNHAQDFAPKTALALQRLLRPDRQPPVAQGDLGLL